MSTLWPSIQALELKRNMRVQSIGGNNDFSRYLLRIGEGKESTVMFGDHGDYIRIPDNLHFSTEGSSLHHAHEKQLIRFIYLNINAGRLDPHDFIDRAILILNNPAIDMLPTTNSRTYIA
ncbi:hypothetical protein BGZ96_002882 [Linnemannia gamsii]|uniref:Uncharacterized protein n=1 Tax=Linnemannia gamsii TaxID=64522 RepID=A0ABQ7JK35_9FUNG|nr:hypothetical protein BGZ96_002882 [Linnemannia gamsii]